MPKLPRNLVRRKDRPGYYFRQMHGGMVTLLSLGNDYEAACSKLRSLKTEGLPRNRPTVAEAAEGWLECYFATARSGKSVPLARRRVGMYLVPFMGHMLLHRVQRDDLRAYRLHLGTAHMSL